MAAEAEVRVPVKTDTSDVVRVLRIIAKHATACADELEAAAGKSQGTQEKRPKAWGHQL